MKKRIMLVMVVLACGCSHLETGPTASVTIKGVPFQTIGERVEVGQMAPDFAALNPEFKPVSLSQFRGKPVLISAVPSLDTTVCSLQTKRFNDELAKLPADVVVLTISMDLPTAQKRFCSQENIKRMQVLSDSALREFGSRYGVLIAKRGVLARSVFVVGRDGRIQYVEVVPEVTTHPNYDAALAAARKSARH